MKHLRILCISIVVTLSAGLSLPVFASDIEMYFSSGTMPGDTNILFMIDNSANMEDSTSLTRLDKVKDGLLLGLKRLEEVRNLNVAIGRFTQIGTDPNTPIIFPFTPIQEALSSSDKRSIAAGIESGDDDAVQATGGELKLNNTELSLVTTTDDNPGPISSALGAGGYTAEIVQSRSGNTWTYTATKGTASSKKLQSLEFPNCAGTSSDTNFSDNGTSLKWTNPSIASETTITVEFTLDADYVATSVTVSATDVDDTTGTATINGPDCSTEDSDGTIPTVQKIGLRFTDLDIPPGAIIESATIDFVSAGAALADTLNIKIEDSADTVAFSTANDIENRTLSTAVNWITGAWVADTTYSSPEVNTLVDTAVNRSSGTAWACGNSLAFIITGDDDTEHQIKSYETSGSAPILNVEYSLPTGTVDCSGIALVSNISPVEKAIERLAVPDSASTTPPLLEGITEAGNYFTGGDVVNGLDRSDNSLYFISNADTHTGGFSAAANECQEVIKSENGNKQMICHIPPGNPANAHTISISTNAWSAHEAHGDTDGACGSDACAAEEIDDTTVTYSCDGEVPASTEEMTICDNGTTTDILISAWSTKKAAGALPGPCLSDYTIPADAKKIDICHYPPGNQDNVHVINISVNALKTHLSHHNDSIYQEKYGCDYNPRTTASASTSTTCQTDIFTGNNCIVLLPGIGQTVTTAITDKVRSLSGDDVNTAVIGIDVTADEKDELDTIVEASHPDSAAQNIATSDAIAQAVVQSISDCFGGESVGNGPVFSATVSEDRFNPGTHNSEVYYVFSQPTSNELWNGNLKKFYLLGNAVCEENPSDGICPSDKNLFDSGYGALGDEYILVEKDGAGSLLHSNSRNIVAYVNTDSKTVQSVTATTTTVEAVLGELIKDSTVAVAEQEADNIKINNGMLGVDTYGDDPTVDRSWLFADTLHSKAEVVNYRKAEADPATDAVTGVLVGTNDGFVRLFDGNTLAEKWAFIPEQLLDQQKGYVSNNCGGAAHSCYGVDSTLSVLVTDNGIDGIDTSDTDDSVRVLFGLGQGGTGFYALDITDFDAVPEVMWYLDETTPVDGSDAIFGQLGQTWNAPVEAIVDASYCSGSVFCKMMLLSGGYDIAQDGGTYGFKFGDSSQGKALYMLDPLASSDASVYETAFTDKKASTPMTYAIVSEVTTLDENKNNIIDTLYMGNVGGEIIRVDLTDTNHTASVDLVAQLSTDDSDADVLSADERSFFEPIEVLRTRIGDSKVNVVVALTGTLPAASAQDYPVEDKLYVFIDDKSTSTVVTDDSNTLHPVVRDNYSYSSENFENRLTEIDVEGWVLSLGLNEMGVGTPVILRDVPEAGINSVSFNTFNTDTSESRLYMVNLLNGDPVVAKNAVGIFELNKAITDDDAGADDARYQTLSNRALGAPQVVKNSDGTSRLLTADGLLKLPGAANPLPKITPANWMQIY